MSRDDDSSVALPLQAPYRRRRGVVIRRGGVEQKLESLKLWDGVDETLGNIAIGHVRENLMAFLKNERGIHAESLMVAVGALAGHAALHAAFEVARPEPGSTSLMTITTSDGGIYYSGDAINAFLIPENPAYVSLWGLVAAGAVASGVPQDELPDYVDIFKRAAATLGTPAFGQVDAPKDHTPAGTPRQYLDAFWPAIRQLLNWSNPTLDDGRRLSQRYWSYVLGTVARQYVDMTKGILDPRLSIRLIMEAAIPMSKVDPWSVQQVLKA